MGFRFRRRFKIFPGVSLNLSRSGVSTSIGARGAHVTVGHGQVREIVGLPGTGLSYTHVEGTQHQTAAETPGEALPPADAEPSPKGRSWRGWLWMALACVLILVIATHLGQP